MGVLLLLMLMTALASALAVSGRTETLVARNHQSLGQARAAAEAGLNHATQAVVAWLALWPGTYASAGAAVDALLADPTVLDTDTIDFSDTYTLGTNLEYEVDLFDEDDPGRTGGAQTLGDDGDATNNEDGDENNDDNRTLVIRALGHGPNNAEVELEAIVGPYKLPAIISDGDLEVGSSVNIIAGDNGGIHSNGDLTFTGTNVITGIDSETGLPDLANGTATASGTYTTSVNTTVTGTDGSGGGRSEKRVPRVLASTYRSWADFVLESTGQMTCNKSGGCTWGTTSAAFGGVVCDASTNPHNQCRSDFGFLYDDGDQAWSVSPVGTEATYGDDISIYVEGDIGFSGNAGTVADPLNISIFAEGSIDVSGNPYLAPDGAEILFVTDGDLEISGNLNMPALEGQFLVHEQVNINSSATLIRGQIVVEDAEDEDTLVTRDAAGVQGATIIYTGAVGNTIFSVLGWREPR
ncbi:MAG: hypothetical protein A3I61_02005 [Acidobacteria bacterium RIFCSPLOWO2_02_FULL_68_18]|nr:MAG: hypothetical protein A3I61_02005 [Acidobacteria bacterium RIFCSPLOWO2_02_FULL_68_18]OFW50250.1 MAG: hypothetical protein A3G77_09785 [Acidobacteria bacterium RIFCSPLOWO2_12_FULL_68_19]